VARPDAEATHDDGMEGPSDDAERRGDCGYHCGCFYLPRSHRRSRWGRRPRPKRGRPCHDKHRRAPGGDASEMVHATELEATLLAASSPEHEAPPPPSPRAPSRPNLRSSPPKPRSKGP
jgi:hypothetical protein